MNSLRLHILVRGFEGLRYYWQGCIFLELKEIWDGGRTPMGELLKESVEMQLQMVIRLLMLAKEDIVGLT